MAVKIVYAHNGYDEKFKLFHIDSEEDVASLPTDGSCCVGSRAVIVTQERAWVLGSDMQWHKSITTGGSGSGDGGLIGVRITSPGHVVQEYL